MIESSTLPESSFADVGFYDFEEIKEKANIPPLSGVAGKVLDILQKRIGESSLNIEDVAADMNLSKRTLQRRLQQQVISFAALRDLVRFNHAIDCLLKKNMSIESTSSCLDFSDRTSFTNAFKRWTNLSPSVFRKVYRDYV
ncbi:MAG: helix-turn-helix domain-containing protein [Cellvibrionaceae bacterium]